MIALAGAGALVAVLLAPAVALAVDGPPVVALSDRVDGLRVWSTEIEGRILAHLSRCDDHGCDLLLVVTSGAPGDDEPTGADSTDGVEERGESAEGTSEQASEDETAERAWSPPALLHLRLDPDGGELHVLSEQLPVSEEGTVDLFDVTNESTSESTADGAARRAALRLSEPTGETIRLVPFAAAARGAGWTLAEPVLRFDEGLAAGPLAAGSGWIRLHEPGRLELVELDARGAIRAHRELAIPFEVTRRGRTLTLESPPVRGLGGGSPRVVIGPQALGSLRLRTLVVDPAAREASGGAAEPGAHAGANDADPGPSAAAIPARSLALEAETASAGVGDEMWSALPGPEKVGDSEVLEIAERRFLVVSTTRADKLSILERKKLRIFELSTDRTRAGSAPLAEILTASRHWQELRWALVDATGDGALDLVLLQPEGLSGAKLAVDLYAGLPGGGFQTKRIRSLVDPTPAVWRYGRDLTGDGVPDLLLASNGRLEVRAGRAVPDKRGLLEEGARFEWSSTARVRGEGEGEGEDDRVRREVAVDGELLLFTQRARGRTVIEVARPGSRR
jgi:hypothetical protein